MNNLAYYLARLYYAAAHQTISVVPSGFTEEWWAERLYRLIAGFPDKMAGGKNTSFWLELLFYKKTNQTYRRATGTYPAWFWLSKLYAFYSGQSTNTILQPANAAFWAEKLANLSTFEAPAIVLTINSTPVQTIADNGTFTPSNPVQGATVTYTVTVRNSGTGELRIQNATRSGDVSSVTAWSSLNLAPGQSATCTITLSTTSSGAKSGAFEFGTNINGALATYTVNVTYTVVSSEISLTVNSIAQADNSTFAPSNPLLGTTVQYTVTATNDGDSTLTLNNASRSGAVSAVTAWSSASVAPAGTSTCTITLDTSAGGAASGYFEFTNNDPDDNESTYRVNVSYTVLNVTPLWALDFNVDAGAPLTSPYTENSSTATLVQVDGQFSKSSGALQFPAQTTPVWGDQGMYRASTFARAAGLAIVAKVNLSNLNAVLVGFGNAAGASYTNVIDRALYISTSAVNFIPSSGSQVVIASALSTATDYYLALVARSAGSALYIKGGTFTNWTLLFEFNQTSSDIAPLFANFSAAGALDYIHVGQIAAAHALASGIKLTLDQASPAVSTNYTGVADGVTTLYYTLPGSPSAGDLIDVRYNYVDSSNFWFIRAFYSGSNWDVYLYSKVAGVDTLQIAVGSIGASNAIRVVRRNDIHRVYSRNTSNVWTKRGADISNSAHSGTSTARLFSSGSWTLSQLTAAPSTDAAYAVLDEI